MTCANSQDFEVSAGATVHPTIRWGVETLGSVPITAVTQAAPVSITAPNHGVADGWPVAVVSVHGMTDINAVRYPPQGSDWHRATVVDENTVVLNDVNTADSLAYVSSGFLVFRKPATLSGVIAHMAIYDNPQRTGTPLVTLTSGSGIVVDPAGMTITPEIQTAGLTWNLGYYELDMTDGDGVVTRLLTGTITITS